MQEAPLEQSRYGNKPVDQGWFVVNLKDTVWREHDKFGRWASFEGEQRFEQLGVNMTILNPGQPGCMYHKESAAEAFLVIRGRARLIVEGQERALDTWDFFHCPPDTAHVLVGDGQEPCAILMIGTRPSDCSIHYPVEPAAAKYGGSVQLATDKPSEAYANSGTSVEIRSPW